MTNPSQAVHEILRAIFKELANFEKYNFILFHASSIFFFFLNNSPRENTISTSYFARQK